MPGACVDGGWKQNDRRICRNVNLPHQPAQPGGSNDARVDSIDRHARWDHGDAIGRFWIATHQQLFDKVAGNNDLVRLKQGTTCRVCCFVVVWQPVKAGDMMDGSSPNRFFYDLCAVGPVAMDQSAVPAV